MVLSGGGLTRRRWSLCSLSLPPSPSRSPVQNELQLPWDRIHLLGYSLGAHVAGVAGDLTQQQISRITGETEGRRSGVSNMRPGGQVRPTS